jgi:hypothetical protein
MSKPIAIIGTPGRVAASYGRDTAWAFAETGHNTGNLAFQCATAAVLADERIHIDFGFRPEAVKDRARLICVPAANFLYSGFDLGGFADRLEATGLPLMVLGLGAQAMKDIAEVKLQPGTERLLRLFGERCARILVRGRYTGQVLERFGVKNFEVLGCPSNFINPDPRMGEGILRAWRASADRPRRLAYAPTFYSYNASFERALHDGLGASCAEIVAQDPLQAVALARGDFTKESTAWLEAKAGFLSALPPEAQARAVAQLRAYFDAEAWMEAYRRLDGVIGTRIHGANLGWQAGRAALVVSYDLRTEELAETMGIPLVKAAALDATQPVAAIEARIETCAGAYDARRARLAALLSAALEAHGATPAPHLRALAEAPVAAPAAGTAARAWGFLELYNRRRIAGWVAGESDTPPELRIRLDGRDVGAASISGKRPDIGARAWSFSFAVPPEAISKEVMRVEAVLAASGRQLTNSPVVTSFAETDARKVLQGRDGWLFLHNDTNAVLDQVQGKRVLSEKGLDVWAAFYRRLDLDAAARGALVVHLVAPNKECVFADRLPENIAVSEARPVRQLEALLSSLGLKATRFVYPLEALRQPAPHATYPKGDSHWSDFGAAVVLDELFAAIGRTPERPAGFRTEWRNADLLSKLGGVCVEPQPVRLRGESAPARLVADNQVVNTGRRRRWHSNDAAGRLLLVHDSFGDWLIPHLAERFQETTTLWGSGVPAEVLAETQPEVLVYERAERFLITPPPA